MLPETLLSPANEAKFLPLFHEYLDKAEAHLRAGWSYTNTLPFGQFRVRLACAWPILIGVRTIEKLRAADVIELQQRVKVSRGEVRGIMLRSTAGQSAAVRVAAVVSVRRKSCCIRRRIGVRKRHANFQVVVSRLRGGVFGGFPCRPRAGHSGPGRRARGVDAKDDELNAQPVAPANQRMAPAIIVTPTGTTVAQPGTPANPMPVTATPASENDTPAQAAARAALMKKIGELNAQPSPSANQTPAMATPSERCWLQHPRTTPRHKPPPAPR